MLDDRRDSPRTRNPAVRERVAALTDADARRSSPSRCAARPSSDRLGLPLFPTTTVGSFPQTAEIRQARKELREGAIDRQEYDKLHARGDRAVIGFQEEIGLDVLVHGEPERNDMVQYFAERIDGYVFTSTPGSSRTARAACGRRSSTATSAGQAR